ncbi:MAG: CHAT domain-containing tetratricopeptide repeat protein [Bacteroidota bacterium]
MINLRATCSLLISFLLIPTFLPAQSADTLLAHQYFQTADSLNANGRRDSAIMVFGQAAEAYKAQGQWDAFHRAIFRQTKACNLSGQVAQGLQVLLPVMKEAEEAEMDQSVSFGMCVAELGLAYTMIGQFDSAEKKIDQALALIQGKLGPKHREVGLVLNKKAYSHLLRAQFPQATRYYEAAIEAGEPKSREDSSSWVKHYLGLAAIQFYLSDYDGALASNRKCVEVWERIYGPENERIASALINIGNCYKEKGNFALALPQFERAQRIFQARNAAPDNAQALCYHNLGSCYVAMDDYGRARDAYLKALDIFQNVLKSQHPQVAITMEGLAIAEGQLGDRATSLRYTQAALAHKIKSLGPDHPSVAVTLNNLSSTYFELDSFSQAKQTMKQALAIMESRENRTNELPSSYMSMAGLVREMGETDSAQYWMARAGEAIQAMPKGKNRIQVEYLLSVAEQDRHLGRDEQAAEKVVAIWKELKEGYGFSGKMEEGIPGLLVLRAMDHEVRVMGKKEAWETAHEKSQEAAAFGLAVRDASLDQTAKNKVGQRLSGMLKRGQDYAYLAYQAKQAPSILEEAYSLSQQSKAGQLNQSLRGVAARSRMGLPASLVEKEQALKAEIGFWEKKVFEARQKVAQDDSLLLSQRARLSALRSEYETHKQSLKDDYPAYFQLVYEAASLRPEEAKDMAARSQTAIVEYSLGEQAAYAFVATADTFAYVQLPGQVSELPALVSGMLGEFGQQGGAAVPTAAAEAAPAYAYRLYEMLWAPLAPLLTDYERVGIIPDGLLGYVPFDALPANPQGRPYLLEQHAISYAYSVLGWQESLGQKARSADLLAFAPDFDAAWTSGENYFAEARANLGPLLHSEAEIDRLQEIWGGALRKGAAASEKMFKDLAGAYGILHLSSHALVENQNPMYSRILFTPGADSLEDGALEVAELFNMQLQADMVVLSACETGVGEVYEAEGIISLARGFSYAGAQSIITSLWQVNDAATADLMGRFYSHLRQGLPKDQALRQAKLDYLHEADALHRHPYYWAAFVPLGNMAPLDPKGPRLHLALGLVLIAIGLFGASWWRYRHEGEHIPGSHP